MKRQRTSHPFTSYTKYALSYSDYMKIMLKCRTLEQTCLIGLACEYGLRREDVVAVEIPNINLIEKRMIFMEHKKNRMVSRPLTDIIVTDLTRHINSLPKGTRFLFPAKRKSSKSGHMSGMEAWRTLQELCIQADIPMPADRKDRPFHALRGTCYKLKRNRDKWTAEQVAAWLGDTITTAMKHYGAVTDSELDDLVRGKL
jgi:integrase